MSYIGYVPAAKPLTSADITDGIITNADIASGAAIAQSKISGSFGKVLQVVTATDLTQRTTTSTSFVTGSNTLSVSITPSSTSNKIFLTATTCGQGESGVAGAYYTIYRGATNLGNGTLGMQRAASASEGTVAISYLDSPSTTSSTTYQVYFRLAGGSGSASLNLTSITASITAFEIAG